MNKRSMLRNVAFATLPVVCAVFLSASRADAQPGPGQLVAAFNPQLTGDPLVDFNRGVGEGETFTIYLISGALPESIVGYRFGFEISQSAAAMLTEVRTLGNVSAFQNSIGTFVSADVTAAGPCFDVTAGTVIAEIDFVRHAGAPDELSVRLVSWIDPQAPPDYQTCGGATVVFDDSAAPTLTITRPAVPVESVSWGVVKSLYNSP